MFDFLQTLATRYSSGYSSSYGSGYGSYGSGYSNTYRSSPSDVEDIIEGMGALGGVFIISMIIFGIIALALAIVVLVAQWKVFTKAGRKGWECLIPYHCNFELLDMSNINPVLILVMIFAPIIPFVGSIAVLVIEIYLCIKLAQSFGKGTGFGVGLALLGFVFWPMLGFGKAQYQGTYYTSQNHTPANAQTPNN